MDPHTESRLATLESQVAWLMEAVTALTAEAQGASTSPARRGNDLYAPSEGEISMARSGRKIEAIKLYRERTGVGLAQAKHAIDLIG